MTIPGSIAQLDAEVTAHRNRYWDEQKQTAAGKTVLLVEGDDDHDVIEIFLKWRYPKFPARVHVVPAGGRGHVLEALKSTFPARTYPNAYGLVDRDTWTDDEAAAQRAAEPRLFVTAGWCLENAFFGPDALQHCGASVATLVSGERERWVRAGALWWALQRTREAQQSWQKALVWSYGSPHLNLDLSSANALVGSLKRAIPEAVRRDSLLDVDIMAERFAGRCDMLLALSAIEQWQIGVHGKRAFKELLAPAQGAEPRALRLELAEQLAAQMKRPPPLDELIAILLP